MLFLLPLPTGFGKSEVIFDILFFDSNRGTTNTGGY